MVHTNAAVNEQIKKYHTIVWHWRVWYTYMSLVVYNDFLFLKLGLRLLLIQLPTLRGVLTNVNIKYRPITVYGFMAKTTML